MKILHTSDWHLGRTLEQNSLHEAHTLYINHLIEVIEVHKVDAQIDIIRNVSLPLNQLSTLIKSRGGV